MSQSVYICKQKHLKPVNIRLSKLRIWQVKIKQNVQKYSKFHNKHDTVAEY